MKGSASLLIFAKYPVPGQVKTRLASEIGDQAACRLYSHFIRVLLKKLLQHPAIDRTSVAVAPGELVARFAADFPGADVYLPQPSQADLGARMQTMIARELAAGFDSVAVIGTDSPQLPAHVFDNAFYALDTADVVLGPASDGGYYLIAVRADHPQLFTAIDWSTGQVLAQTLAAAARANLTVHLLDEHYDVDTWVELQRLAKEWPALVSASGVFEEAPELSSRLLPERTVKLR